MHACAVSFHLPAENRSELTLPEGATRGEKVQAHRRHHPFSAEYVAGPGPTRINIGVFRNSNGQIRVEFIGNPKPPYMKVVISDKLNKRAVELDPEAHVFWNLGDGIGEPPWLSMPAHWMVMTGDTKIILGMRCKLYVLDGTDKLSSTKTWVADDLGVTVRELQILDEIEQVTLEMTSLNVGEPDHKLFVVPQGYHEIKEPREWEE